MGWLAGYSGAALASLSSVIGANTTADYPAPARRRATSRLSTDALTRDREIGPRPWQAMLDDMLSDLH